MTDEMTQVNISCILLQLSYQITLFLKFLMEKVLVTWPLCHLVINIKFEIKGYFGACPE